jgi:hypothetical protein
MSKKKNLLDSLSKEIPLATPQELIEMVMALQMVERSVQNGVMGLDVHVMKHIMDSVALLVHDVVILRRNAGLDMMYDEDLLHKKEDQVVQNIKEVLDSKDYKDITTETETTELGIVKSKKEMN